MNPSIPSNRPAGSPLARAYGATDPDRALDTLRKLQSHFATRSAALTSVAKGAKIANLRVVYDRSGRKLLVDAAKIHPVVQKAQAPMVAVYDDDGNLIGALDAGKLNKTAQKGDEAVLDLNGSIVGYARAADVQPLSTGTKPKASVAARPTAPAAPAVPVDPSPEQVQKASRLLKTPVRNGSPSEAEMEWAVKVLQRNRVAKSAAPARRSAATSTTSFREGKIYRDGIQVGQATHNPDGSMTYRL
ncbi:MAG: hypothetical protein ACYDAL_02060 [Candidatus Dormibacteraceae bacterium]